MKIFGSPPKRKQLDYNNIDVNQLVRESNPTDLLFNSKIKIEPKFGNYRCTNCAEGFDFHSYEEIAKIDELDKWKFIALCALQDLYNHKYYLDKIYYEEYKKYLAENGHKCKGLLIHLANLEEEEKNE